MTQEVDVDIRQFLIMALGANEYLHSDIDAMYEENKLAYYQAYKESNYFNYPMFNTYTTHKNEKMKKVAGIVHWDYTNNTDVHLMKLIKKGYKFSYQYVKQRTKVDIQEFGFAYTKKRKEDIPEMELFSASIIVMYLCIKQQKQCDLKSDFGKTITSGIREHMSLSYYDDIFYTEEIFQENRHKIDQLYKEFHIPQKKTLSIDFILENIINKEVETKLLLSRNPDYFQIRHNAFREGISKYVGAYSGWFKSLGINSNELGTSVFLSPKEIDKVLYKYFIAVRENHLDDREKYMFVVSCFWIAGLAKEYQKTKHEYFNDLTEQYFDDIISLRNQLSDEKEIFEEKTNLLDAETKKIKEEKLQLQRELEKVKQEYEEMEQELKKREDNTKELLSLRNLAFSLDMEKTELEGKDDVPKVIEKLQTYQCAVIGGHPNWQHRLKKELPHFVFVNVEEKGRSLAFLDKMDAVFINTTYNSHSFYRKVMNQMNKNNVPLLYLKGYSGMENTLHEFYELLT